MDLPEWFEKAKELFLKGYTYTKIGEELSINRKRIAVILKKEGYISPSIIKNSGKGCRKYTVNDDFFEVIDTEEKAYWLGFMYADGYVSDEFKTTIELSLKGSDTRHIEKLKSSISSNHPIYQTKKIIKGVEYIGARLTISSLKMKADLIAKGCVPRKTMILKFPSYDIVPKELMRHFIRGYVDADGCITRKKQGGYFSLEIVGTEEFLKGIIKELNIHENKIHKINGRNTVSRVMYCGKFANSIIYFLYNNSTISLDRKYNLAKNCVPSIV